MIILIKTKYSAIQLKEKLEYKMKCSKNREYNAFEELYT